MHASRHLNFTEILRPIDIDLLTGRRHRSFFMPEDPRAFHWGDEMWMAFSDDERDIRRMFIQRVHPSPLPSERLRFEYETPHWEKNWAPLGPVAGQGDLYYLFARTLVPHMVLQCDQTGWCDVAAQTDGHTAFFEQLKRKHNIANFHMGTNAVRPDVISLWRLHMMLFWTCTIRMCHALMCANVHRCA